MFYLLKHLNIGEQISHYSMFTVLYNNTVRYEAVCLQAQWMALVLCVIMDIHPRVSMPGLMKLRLGILCNVQAHFLLTHIPLGVA